RRNVCSLRECSIQGATLRGRHYRDRGGAWAGRLAQPRYQLRAEGGRTAPKPRLGSRGTFAAAYRRGDREWHRRRTCVGGITQHRLRNLAQCSDSKESEMTGTMITVAGTGGEISKQEVPHLPASPEEIAAMAQSCEAAGAAMIHI